MKTSFRIVLFFPTRVIESVELINYYEEIIEDNDFDAITYVCMTETGSLVYPERQRIIEKLLFDKQISIAFSCLIALFFDTFAIENANFIPMKATIDNIRIGGFANLQDISLSLNKLSALVAPNNYGKSNVLRDIVFGFDFMQASPAEKRTMMTRKTWMPINSSMIGSPLSFEISSKA